MNMRKLTLLVLCGSTAFLLAVQCANPGSGTETGNGLVTAMLYNPGGSPAANADVRFCHHDNDPRPGHDSGVVGSTKTDANGNYTITLDPGPYTIEASGDSGLAYQDLITAVKGDTVRPNPDTLKPAGSIKGIVRLEEGGDPTTVFILFMGTRTFTWPDDTSGSFTSDSMAAGTYRVRILTTTPNYKTLDTNLGVIAGAIDSLPQPIVLKFIGIPTPKNVRIVYDTLKQIVNLSWDSANASLVSYYNVYRRNVTADSTPVKINASPVRAASYSDSTGTQDVTYEYQVAAVNASASEGTKSAAVSVEIVGMFVIKRIIGQPGTGVGQYQGPSAVAVSKDGKVFISDIFGNKVLIFDTLGNFLKQDTGFRRPIGIELKNNNSYFVLEDQPRKVRLIDSLGSTVFQIDSVFGTQPIGWDMAISPTGDLYIPDAENNRIRVFDSLGSFKKDLAFNYEPRAIAFLDSGRFILGFSNINGNTAVVDTNGNIVSQWSGPPSCIALTKNGNIIGDWGNHYTIRIFTREGFYLGKYVYNSTTDNGGLTTDSFGNVYISMVDAQKVIVIFNGGI